MARTGTNQPAELGYGAWIGFWLQLIILGLFVVIGAFFASADSDPGDYSCGMLLILASLALAFMRLKARLDGSAIDWSYLLVDDIANLIAIIVIFVILGLAGLFAAASIDSGGLHDGGVALFVASALAVFLNMKRVFDNLERRHRG
jgi:hypothetical protein